MTKDSTQVRPAESVPIMSKAWTEKLYKTIPGKTESGIRLEDFQFEGIENYKEKGKEIIAALKLPTESEQREALAKLGIITMNAGEIKSKIAAFLKDHPEKVKEIKQLFRESWHYMGCNTSKSVTAKGLATKEWNMVIMMMIMED